MLNAKDVRDLCELLSVAIERLDYLASDALVSTPMRRTLTRYRERATELQQQLRQS